LEIKHKNHIALIGKVISPLNDYRDGKIFIVNTNEEVRSKNRNFSADHTIYVPEENLSLLDELEQNDTVMVFGYITNEKRVTAKDFSNISAIFKPNKKLSQIRHKNHVTIYGEVTSDIQIIRNGFIFFVTTTTEKDSVTTEHTVYANDYLKNAIANTKKGDYVLIEGPLSKDGRLIVSSFNNVSQAFKKPAECRIEEADGQKALPAMNN
jgi:hypothetical protein